MSRRGRHRDARDLGGGQVSTTALLACTGSRATYPPWNTTIRELLRGGSSNAGSNTPDARSRWRKKEGHPPNRGISRGFPSGGPVTRPDFGMFAIWAINAQNLGISRDFPRSELRRAPTGWLEGRTVRGRRFRAPRAPSFEPMRYMCVRCGSKISPSKVCPACGPARRDANRQRAFRHDVIARDGACQHCGATDKLIAAHVIPVGELAPHERYLAQYGTALCSDCHCKVDKSAPRTVHFGPRKPKAVTVSDRATSQKPEMSPIGDRLT